MSFASKYRGKELTVMVKLLSVFGVVEVRQMRELFSHLDTKKYGKIMTLLHREGMVYTTPDAKHLPRIDVGGEGRYQQQRILLLGAYQHQRQHTGFLRWRNAGASYCVGDRFRL